MRSKNFQILLPCIYVAVLAKQHLASYVGPLCDQTTLKLLRALLELRGHTSTLLSARFL